MGNISSNIGNNFNEHRNQTPLNKFIEKVMNENYFFTPNLSNDMIKNVDKTDINNNKVLLKRALCTGRSIIPISLPYHTCVDGRCESGTYTININATSTDGVKLPDISNITGKSYTDAINTAIKIENNNKNVSDINTLGTDNDHVDHINARAVLKYRSIAAAFGEQIGGGAILKYSTVDTKIKDVPEGSRIGSGEGCKLFYRGPSKDIRYEISNDPNSYNSFDDRTGKSIAKGLCGKVLQYSNNEGITSIGQHTLKKDKDGNGYRTDEFQDCACLNSALAINKDKIITMQDEIFKLASDRGKPIDSDNGPSVSAQELAQSNDNYCKNHLYGELAPNAYASAAVKLVNDYKVCNMITTLHGVDQEGGDFKLDPSCELGEDDKERINKCINNPNAIGCSKHNADVNQLSVEDEDGLSGMDIACIVIVIVILFIVGGLMYQNKRRLSGNASTDNVSNVDAASNIKYNKPSSDPLYRELKY